VINLTTHRTGVGSVAGNGGTTMYGEWHTRISPGRIFGSGPLRIGPIGDVLTAHEVNATSGVMIHAHGGGIAWRVPGIQVLSTNLLLRDNRDQEGITWQLAAAWFVPIRVDRVRFVATGFADFFGAEGSLPAEILGDAQFLLDIGDTGGTEPGRLFLGTELHFQRSQPRQLVPQALLKWTF
jgi:nucleoside-specific outer membrane channel protein Tsx